MSNPAWTDVNTLKSSLYLALSDTNTLRDAALLSLIEAVTDAMFEYIDDPDYDITSPSLSIQRACAKQCTYEYRRRNDLGLSSVTFKDGNVNKYEVNELLPEVKTVLYRKKKLYI